MSTLLLQNELVKALNAVKFNLEFQRCSVNTIYQYERKIIRFVEAVQKPIHTLTSQDAANYIFPFVNSKYSSDHLNQIRAALRLFFTVGLQKSFDESLIPRIRKQFIKPAVLSQEEIKQILSHIKNPRYRIILYTCYSSGLRIGEALNLRVKDIDSKNMQVIVRQGKNRKDRYTILSQSCLDALRRYWKMYQPKGEYLFPGDSTEKPMTRQGIQKMFHMALLKTGIPKKACIHTLRHAFAAHLYESGVDLPTIQVLLGHSSIASTNIYMHISRKHIQGIKSPTDNMGGDFLGL